MSKVKVDFSDALKKLNRFSEAGSRLAVETLKEEIVDSIDRGVSPVAKQGGRFQRYSTSYSQAIDRGRYRNFNKKKRPVNLRLSGKLLKSIFSKRKGKTIYEIGFDNELADIHNRQGAGKSQTVRRMLPTERGESFSKSILFAVGVRLNKAAKRFFR